MSISGRSASSVSSGSGYSKFILEGIEKAPFLLSDVPSFPLQDDSHLAEFPKGQFQPPTRQYPVHEMRVPPVRG
ncbi:hypothetical protein GQ602_005808 [Ophiocordyceps camponoti-floridani]|uniref:Uncharacterized protein n=1 Tax=Ophiocordyceps camponoti-floridani TaxID=2030778 RepID=A0A8H4Q4D5_9HYPO|nr:hypothetical protein GQ602_005808 [Ophiocordyceps camponoti-floridani]